MGRPVDSIIDEIRKLEKELVSSLQEGRKRYSLRGGKVFFTQEELKEQARNAQGLIRYIATIPILNLLSSPVIYMMFVPIILMDIFVTLYQSVCFPIYGIPKVSRKAYLFMDRHHLKYLNIIERLNCLYCSYFNGVVAYVREIAARTELYWCPIKHSKTGKGLHPYYHQFIDYGEYQRLKEAWAEKRALLKHADSQESPESGEMAEDTGKKDAQAQ